jgi:hypothetical protein
MKLYNTFVTRVERYFELFSLTIIVSKVETWERRSIEIIVILDDYRDIVSYMFKPFIQY